MSEDIIRNARDYSGSKTAHGEVLRPIRRLRSRPVFLVRCAGCGTEHEMWAPHVSEALRGKMQRTLGCDLCFPRVNHRRWLG